MNKDNQDFIELDLLCANLESEVKALQAKNTMLEQECSAMREQIRSLENRCTAG